MTASFGKLQGQKLELQDGLNIIQAPNETGKSTWCAFLLAMLYGINSRERDKAGYIAEKNRYAPWSGSSMSGRLDCRVDGEDWTLTRTTKRQNAPMGEFRAVYTGTDNPVPQLTGQTCGEQLLGVSREVFERSAFIRQAGLPISQDAGLERRIAALITSGEEDTSYSEVLDTLKKQLNRRRHNKTGQIPTLESELADIRQQLTSLEQLSVQLSAVQTQIETLTIQERDLSLELTQHDHWATWQKTQEQAKAEAQALQAQQTADMLQHQILEDRVPENETIGRLRGALVNLETTRKAVDKARTDWEDAAKELLRAESQVNESPFAGQTAESAREAAFSVSDTMPWSLRKLLPSLLLGLAALLVMALNVLSKDFRGVILYGVPLVIALARPFYQNRKWKKEASTFLQKHGVSSAAELRQLSAVYGELLNARDAAQAEADRRHAAADTLYSIFSSNEQAILLEIRRFAPAAFDLSAADQLLRECATRRKALAEAEHTATTARMRADLLAQQLPASPAPEQPSAPPLRSKDMVSAELAQCQAQLAAAQSTADRLSGQLQAVGDPVVLRSSADHLAGQIERLEEEYAAIQLAMDALTSANTALQNRFSPALGRRTAEIFAALTEHRYSGVVLDRSLHLSAEPAGEGIYRDSQLLSAGAADQLYLAARLAICDLVLPEEHNAPIVLDDALANFDDKRCAAALQWLKKEAKTRQILLFTCHSREADFLAGDSEVFIQRLTNAV